MATPSRVDQLLQRTEVIQTDASFAVFFLQAVASTASSKEPSFATAVNSTAAVWGSEKPIVKVLAPAIASRAAEGNDRAHRVAPSSLARQFPSCS